MKKSLKILVVALFMGSLFSSCNDFLTHEPYNFVSDESAITNTTNATYAMNGIYARMRREVYYGRNFIVFGDAATENIILSPSNSGRFIANAQWSVTDANADLRDAWTFMYSSIDAANRLIAVVDNIEGDALLKKQLKGEALAVRALAHFDLVRLFGQTYKGNESSLGVPYMKSSVIYEKPARETVAEVYAKIITDLKDAIVLLEQKSSADAPYKIDEWAAKGLLARVYMAMQDYASAKPILANIVTNSGYRLLTNGEYNDAWAKQYNATKKVEFMFAIASTQSDYAATGSLGYIFLQTGYGDLRASTNVVALYNSNDIRRTRFFKAGTGAAAGFTMVDKYPSRDGVTGLSDSPVLRLSDVYLMYAEACAETNDEPTAITYLDYVRQRCDPTALTSTETGNALKDKIFLERRKELAFEGLYLFDLKRLQKTIRSAYNGAGQLFATIEYPSKLLAYPIPMVELEANPNMRPNP